jgi:amino acid adenylation domain-containing protein
VSNLVRKADSTLRCRSLASNDTLVAGFDSQAAATPDAVAVICGDDEVLTYEALARRADRLAHHLHAGEMAARPGGVVAVCLDRDVNLIVALLAVLKAGAAYAMLDPQFPDSRLAWMMKQAGARVVITDDRMLGRFTESSAAVVRLDDCQAAYGRQRADRPQVAIRPDDAACVMFTSGSTGTPKGMLTSHRAVYRTFADQRYLDFGPSQVWLQCSPVSWDAFALEVFGPLIHGGTCVLHPGHRVDPGRIVELVTRHQVTTLQLSASLFNVLVDEYPAIFSGMREVMTAGEPASSAHCVRLLRRFPGIRLLNGYGPAESMGFTTTYEIDANSAARSPIPIGSPIEGKGAYVLDERLRPVPMGTQGELYVAGVGLAHGYLGSPAATAERFVANPFGAPGSRMYRTGDIARYNGEGLLEFIGRADAQIKIRGFRVDPHEVEAAIVALPPVSRAAVVARADREGGKKLIGYVVPRPGMRLAPDTLRRSLFAVLPEHLVPSALVPLDTLPLTANGKLDQRALPPPPAVRTHIGRAARTQTEEVLRDLIAKVLGMETDQVGVDDNFFDLGMNSLAAIELVAQISRSMVGRLPVRDIYLYPTIEGIAERIQT